ncbi:MAG: IS200/IS605 family transposase [Acidobacteria bacterium]|nr:MAG: IS200/IS605 family transposase [Acidobacteriota bacterium]
MSHTYVSELIHVVFSTKGRQNSIPRDTLNRLGSFLGGIARNNGFKTIAIGGTENHVHVLLSLPATMPLAKAVQLLKGGSSKWLNETIKSRFEWQQGYGAFSVSISQQVSTIAYINRQAEHHRKRNFEEEFIAFLKKHNVDYDPRYVLG